MKASSMCEAQRICSKLAGVALLPSSPTGNFLSRRQRFDHFKVALSVAVMKMVRADLAASGVIFTLDTESGFRDVVLRHGLLWPWRNHRSGSGRSDEFYVHKPTLKQGFRHVLRRHLGASKFA